MLVDCNEVNECGMLNRKNNEGGRFETGKVAGIIMALPNRFKFVI